MRDALVFGTLFLDRGLNSVDDLIPLLEEAEWPTTGGEVIDVLRDCVDEVGRL